MNKIDAERTPKVLPKLTSSNEKLQTYSKFDEPSKLPPYGKNETNKNLESTVKAESHTKVTQSSTENSFLNDLSIRSESSLKQGSQVSTPMLSNNPRIHLPNKLSEEQAISVLFNRFEVLVNRTRNRIRAEFVPCSTGLRYVLVLSHTWISLSWLHSVQELEKSKLLLLYYDMHEVGNGTRPKIESLVVEFSREALMQQFLTAVSCLHEKYHDEDVEKVYHFLC